jgi:hypothetical protein
MNERSLVEQDEKKTPRQWAPSTKSSEHKGAPNTKGLTEIERPILVIEQR